MSHDPFDFDTPRQTPRSALAVLDPLRDEHDARAPCAADHTACFDGLDPVRVGRHRVPMHLSRIASIRPFRIVRVAGWPRTL